MLGRRRAILDLRLWAAGLGNLGLRYLGLGGDEQSCNSGYGQLGIAPGCGWGWGVGGVWVGVGGWGRLMLYNYLS